MVPTYPVDFRTGIRRTKGFEKKGLATHAVNVGLKCCHDCTYCSTGTMIWGQAALKATGKGPYEFGYSLIDVKIAEKVAKDVERLRAGSTVQLCTTVDAWDPVAQKHDLGRRCLMALLKHEDCTVRILTKNAAVTNEFDLIAQHRDRVLVGLSLTGTPSKQSIIKVTEPNASTIAARMAALKQAHDMGLRVFGMLCPLLPGVSDSYEDILELVEFVTGCGAEEVFAEAMNPRGKGPILTAAALRAGGYETAALAVDGIRRRSGRMEYVGALVSNLQKATRKHGMIDKLRFLLYGKDLTTDARQELQRDDAGVVWL